MDRVSEGKAAELFQCRRYEEAAVIYTQCLQVAEEQSNRINLLLNRASCWLNVRKFDEAQADCDEVLKGDEDNEKALWKKSKVLCFQGRFHEAHVLATEWITREPENPLAKKELKRLEIVFSALKDQYGEEESPDSETRSLNKIKVECETAIIEERIPPEGREAGPQTSPISNPTVPTIAKPVSQAPFNNVDMNIISPLTVDSDTDNQSDSFGTVEEFNCSLCELKFDKSEELDSHIQSDQHKAKILPRSDGQWKHRPPPRGLTSEEYTLCARFFESGGRCCFGDKCMQAHSDLELLEWRERFDHRRQRIQQARENNIQGTTYVEQLQEKLLSAELSESVITESLEIAKVHCNGELKESMCAKKCNNAWIFTVTSKIPLHRTMLLDDTYRSYFFICTVSVGPKKIQRYQNIDENCQEWTNPDRADVSSTEYVYRIKMVFKADIYGTFRQTVVFDFGSLPVLCRLLQVDSAPPAEGEKFSKELLLNVGGRWDNSIVDLVEYDPKPIKQTEKEQELLTMYSCPHPEKFNLSRALFEPLCKENYRKRMHELLFIEEMEQFGIITRYNMKSALQLVNRFMLIPGTLSTAKYAQSGELFARMRVEDDLSEDSVHGRLILQSCQTAWIAPDRGVDSECPETAYEALIEDKGKNFIFFRLSAACVMDLNLTCDTDFKARVQFHLNRLPTCEMHYGVDKLATLDLVFPNITQCPSIPWTPDRQWTNNDCKLNAKQKEAIIGITAPKDLKLPPILLCGPYGTGKTYTLAQAAKQVLKESDTKILICTHSNSAADLYIKDFLHPYVLEGHPEACPLRIYYRHRWKHTVPDSVLPYCLMADIRSGGTFRLPTLEDLEKCRVVVATLGTSRYICDLNLKPGFFTHIFLDEAAQAMECETLLPLAVAGETTRIVLAGDHMQLSPEVYSAFVKERELHRSLLERLYDIYPNDFQCKIMLCENYRSHEAIIDFTSELFYDCKLVASGKQPAHEMFHPLTFFMAKGEEVQHMNSTGFYNMAEIYEVVDRVEEIQKSWPSAWGELCESSIGVVAPYSDQVVRIRSELRKRKMFRVSVERVLNVQGKQFRAILLSTVRTRLTCNTDSSMEDVLDYGFLSNVKLLNTAITRAQSLVAVVGDPVSLCAVGKCRKIWEHFIKLCDKKESLHGSSWQQVRLQLDGLEMKRTYVLNPLAPEFIPNRLRHGSHTLNGADLFGGYGPYSYMYAPFGAGAAGAGVSPGHKHSYPTTHPRGLQSQMMYPYMSPPPYGFGIYPPPWMMPPRFFKHPSGMLHPHTHRSGKGGQHTARSSSVSRHMGMGGPHSNKMAAREASPSNGARPAPEGEAVVSSASTQTSPPNPKTRTSGRFPVRHVAGGHFPVFSRGAHVPPMLPYPTQMPYGMYLPDDPRLYMLQGGYPMAPFGFLPMGPVPYPMPRHLSSFPGGMVLPRQPGYHGPLYPFPDDQHLSPNSSNRSTPASLNSGLPGSTSSLDTKSSCSPSSSPNSFQNIKLLPNVKHAPAHLFNPDGSEISTTLNSPVLGGAECSRGHFQDQEGSPRHQFQDKGRSPSPAGIVHIKPPKTLTPEFRNGGARGFNGQGPHSQRRKGLDAEAQISVSAPLPNTVDLSVITRQYSDELQTPTQIHDLMKMLEESDEKSPRKYQGQKSLPIPVPRLAGRVFPGPSSPLQVLNPYDQQQRSSGPGFCATGSGGVGMGKDLKLDINLANRNQVRILQHQSPYLHHPQLQQHPPPFSPSAQQLRKPEGAGAASPPNSLPLPEHDSKPTYAGVLRRPPPSPCSPQPQTPMTPVVFSATTPRDQMGNDAMDILRNLNIKASPGTQALYQYFS